LLKGIEVPAQRIAMRRIREVLRLKDECALTYSQIARALGISKGSVANYLSSAEAAGLTHQEVAGLDDAALLRRLYPQRYVYAKFAAPDFAQVHRELKRKGVTLTLLWEEYRESAQGVPYSRSRFFERYQAFVATLRRSMRQTHVAGEKLFVDYAGQTVPVVDMTSGAERRTHVFVAVWGASNFTYAEATWSETKADWISAHVNAFAYAAGVPALLVPDNPKALISEANRYEPEPNRTYQALAEHYGCAVLPARPRKPRDKAKVEAGVQLVERWILARLRHRRFFSLVELNAAIRALLEDLNNRPFQKLEGSRRSWFELLERPVLRPLPPTPFEYAEFKRARVSRLDYHVEFERHYYSVPHALVLNQLNIPNSWYPGFPVLRREVRNASISAASFNVAVRAAAAGSQAQGLVAGGAGAPAIPSDQRGVQGKNDSRGRRPHRLPLYGGIRLGAPFQRQRFCDVRTGGESERPAGHLARRAIARSGRCGAVESRRAGAAVFQLVGTEAGRILPQQGAVTRGDR
jgi:transposase